MDIRGTAQAALFEKVTKVYPGRWRRPPVTALAEVSLAVPWGQAFGLVGPNRAGKTTLVKILLSICQPTSGRIMRLGCPYSDRGTLAEIGYVHENPSFPRYLTAWQLVEGYGRLSGLSRKLLRQRTGELLERVGLSDRAQEAIARFSKGMLQRLALAQALVCQPRLLVLDEPSEGMDLSARRLLHEVIRERKQNGHSVILVSHALADVERLCDQVAVLRDGRLAFVGPVAALARQNETQEPRDLERAVESLYEGALA
jgi:ABC-2 type transport system ATP-binding protein